MIRQIGVLCLIVLLAAAGSAVADSTSHAFTASSTIEYQAISQEYYDAIFDTTTNDPIERWVLATDQITDMIFRTDVGLSVNLPDNLINLKADFELSGDRFLSRAEGIYLLGDTRNNLRLRGKFENKSPYDQDEADAYLNVGYNYYRGELLGRTALSNRIRLNTRLSVEAVSFAEDQIGDSVANDNSATTSISGYRNYDYNLWQTRLGGDFFLGNMDHQISWSAGFSHRRVPDSLEADYNDLRFLAEYIYVSLATYVSFEGEVQLKDYNKGGGEDDFTAFYVRGRGTIDLGGRWDGSLSLYLEHYGYAFTDIINRDYTLIKTQVKFVNSLSDWSLGPVGKIAYRTEEPYDDIEGSFDESYTEGEFGLTGGYLGLGDFFFDIEGTFGHREYVQNDDILTSYNFLSASLVASYSFTEYIALNILFDGEFEYHAVREDNSNLLLVSIGLTARF